VINNVCDTNLKVQTIDGKLSDRTYFVEQKFCCFTKMLSGTYVVCKDNVCLTPNFRKGYTMNAVPTLFSNAIL